MTVLRRECLLKTKKARGFLWKRKVHLLSQPCLTVHVHLAVPNLWKMCAALSGPPKACSIPWAPCQVFDSFESFSSFLLTCCHRMEVLCWLQTSRKKKGGTHPSCILTGKLSSALDTLKWKHCKCQLPWQYFACRSMIGGVSSLSFGCCSLINCYFCQCGGRIHTGFLAVIAAPVDWVNFHRLQRETAGPR